MAEVTHVLESLLDRVRKGETGLSEEMVDAFLDAGDVLKRLLGAHQGEGETDPDLVQGICRRLRQLSEPTGAAAFGTADSEESRRADAELKPSSNLARYRVAFVLESAAGTAPVIFENLLAELHRLGEVSIGAGQDAADSRKPCVLTLATDAGSDAIHNVLEFVAASDSIDVARIDDAPASLEDAEDGSYGFFGPLETEHAQGPAGIEASPAGSGGDRASLGAATAASAADPGYGFFDDLAPASAASSHEGGPEPAPQSGPTPPAAASATRDATKEALGNPGATAAKPGRDAGSIRVGVERVDLIINLVGELVITQAMLTQSASCLDPVVFERLMNGLVQLERNTRDLQEAVMSIRMVPISMVFSRFPRVVRDISQKLGKQVELRMSGENTDLDKG